MLETTMNRALRRSLIIAIIAGFTIILLKSLSYVMPYSGQIAVRNQDLVYIGETRVTMNSRMENNTADFAFIRFLSKLHYACENSIRLGNRLDGGWDMCLAGPYKPKKPCLVYSFGINRDFSFDDAVSANFECTIRSFDPSMKTKSHRRNQNVWFYNIGIGRSNGINEKGWTLKTLHTLVTEFNESDVVIDYLKIDIEDNEWTSLVTMLSDGTLSKVKQFGIEVHVEERDTANLVRKYVLLKRLEDAGFRRWYYALNYYRLRKTINGFRSCCYEMVYINKNYIGFIK